MQRQTDENRVSSSSHRDSVYAEKSFLPSMIGCIGLVVAVGAVTIAGTASAVNALNRNAANQIAMAKRPHQVVVGNDTVTPPAKEDDVSSASKQLEWAKKYGIVWDEGGNPIDKDGNIMNDPTTTVNEVARAIARGDATAEGVSMYWLGQQEAVEPQPEPEPEPEPTTPATLYEGITNVSQRSDGTYIYTVQRGDCLTDICGRLGVEMPTMLRMNQLKNPSFLEVGQQLVLPSNQATQNQSGAGLG